ncbi:hypothetical protein E1287_31825 [Actinomadura sp. KC06]|uniref:hypothetical protein n=1 Tax=Actinomadura sp. KC06 TaxID=2530369 RepID=UPI001044CB7C|nr:hypothetical protein [Actinomadura sp. KC06]TDD28989.1 hypothetical protein E1287_31825 [Actinomadura sp. KC06]
MNRTIIGRFEHGPGLPRQEGTNAMPAPRIGFGSTPPGQGWEIYYDNIYIDVDTSSAEFTGTPIYIASLGGDGTMWDYLSASAIYTPTPTGFRVYLQHHKSDQRVEPSHAQQYNFHINWIGVENP